MEEAMQVLKDSARFTVNPSSVGVQRAFGQAVSGNADTTGFFTQGSMLTVDEPDHRRLRRLVSKAFTPRYMEGLRPRVQEIADELLDGVHGQGRMDVVEDYAFPLPINVISDMLGAHESLRGVCGATGCEEAPSAGR
jgi:cytochrome P450